MTAPTFETIGDIVQACIAYKLIDRDAADATGAMLIEANADSVSYRYDEVTECPGYVHEPAPATAGQVAKSLTCYLYNACEHPGWETSEARALCLRLAVALLDRIPGYDEGEWR